MNGEAQGQREKKTQRGDSIEQVHLRDDRAVRSKDPVEGKKEKNEGSEWESPHEKRKQRSSWYPLSSSGITSIPSGFSCYQTLFPSTSDAKTCKDGNTFPSWPFNPPHWQRERVLELFYWSVFQNGVISREMESLDLNQSSSFCWGWKCAMSE